MASEQSCSASACFFAGRCYQDNATHDLYGDQLLETCEDGKWNHTVMFELQIPDSITPGQEITIRYTVHNLYPAYDTVRRNISLISRKPSKA